MSKWENSPLGDLARQAVSLGLVDGVESSGEQVLIKLGRLRMPFSEAEAANYFRGLLRVHARQGDLNRGQVGV